MPLGVSLTLYDGSTPLAEMDGIKAFWWDYADPMDTDWPIGCADNLATDSSGNLKIDLTWVTQLQENDYGFLLLWREGTSYQQDRIFAGRVPVTTVTSGQRMRRNSGFIRPSDWPAIWDGESESVEKAEMVISVWPQPTGGTGNRIAIKAQGAFTIDWGDGSTPENFASGATAEHIYDYGNTNLIPCSEGYKTAKLVLTPQSGQNITLLDLSQRPSAVIAGGNYQWANPILDFVGRLPSLTSLSIYDLNAAGTSTLRLCRRFWLTDSDSFSTKFAGMFALRDCVLVARNGADLSGDPAGVAGFSHGYSLLIPPYISGFGSNVSFSNVFNSCTSLKVVPKWPWATVASSLLGCFAVSGITRAEIDIGTKAIDISSLFWNCYSLERVSLNAPNATNVALLFHGCRSLTTIDQLNLPNPLPADLSYLFYECRSLKVLPELNYTSGHSTYAMFTRGQLIRAKLPGMATTFDISNQALGAHALNELFGSLGTVSGQTITVTGNYGISEAGYDRTIAANKGWTIVE